ncbi:sulfate transporter [Mycobacterium sp. MYCO198283]|nr:STAS domain-containing protein [Mycobacterium sp. MYCO198283]MCG5431030.1 sulfate transporter [Mycobacterium sp. MYCO198283]
MSRSPLHTTAEDHDGAALLTVDGVLDSTTYLLLRDTIVKAALDQPLAVIIDVASLAVPAPSAWAVFTSARWHVSTWPEVPIALVCRHAAGREAIAANGVARYVPVYPSVAECLTAVTESPPPRVRRRMRVELPAVDGSVGQARDLVTDWLRAWSMESLIPTAKVVVSALVENVLDHTNSAPALRVESNGTTVTVAVEDSSARPAGRREDPARGRDLVSGLAVVAAVAHAWGTAPTPSGKTVWAVIGPDAAL